MDTVYGAATLRAMKAELPNLLISRRTRLFRRSALVWAVVFTLFGVRSAYADAECSHHTGHAAHAATGAEQSATPHDHAPGGSGHGHHAAESVPDGTPEEEHDAAPCLCIEACHLAGVHSLAGSIQNAPRLPEVARRDVPLATAARRDAVRAPFVLPFATAPPAVR
jgi:hypothetical protein